MCGIAGIVGEVEELEETLVRMAKAQLHRGPDSKGSWITLFADAWVGMVYNRLALHEHQPSLQPDVDEELGLSVVLDGRIDNRTALLRELETHYRFRTGSDTELLLKAYHRWGKKCPERLSGAFAFAVYDRSGRRLFLARDRFGIKPLYYSRYRGNFYFASEIKALFAARIPKRPSVRTWIGHFVHNSYATPPETFWEEIFELPGGSWLSFDPEGVHSSRWYDFKEAVARTERPVSEKEAAEQWLALAQESLVRTLRTNRQTAVATGDPSASEALLHLLRNALPDLNRPVYAYGAVSRHDAFTEKEALAKTFGCPFEPVRLTAGMIVAEAQRLVRMQDEPFEGFDILGKGRLFRTARQRGIVVLYDETGWPEIRGDRPAAEWSPKEDAIAVLSPEAASSIQREEAVPERPYENGLHRMTQRLRFGERASMAYSTELRSPFLDHRLVEFSFALPAIWRKRAAEQLKTTPISGMIPTNGKKDPSLPEETWLSKELHSWSRDAVERLRRSDAAGWFNFPEISRRLEAFDRGIPDSGSLRWKWINLQMLQDA